MARDLNGRGPDPQGEEETRESDAALKARLEALSHKLEAQHSEESKADTEKEGMASSFRAANLGFQALIEFVTAVVVAPIIGWEIDAWLKTKPIFFIIFLFLGMAAGLLNVYRLAARSRGRGYDTQTHRERDPNMNE